MKYLISAAVAAAALAVSAAGAQAQTWYGSVGASRTDSGELSFGMVEGRLGARINDNFGVEAEAGFGITEDDYLGVDVKIKRSLGLAAVVYMPISENTDLFARLGFANAEFEASTGGVTANEADDAVLLGLGGQYFWAGNNGVRYEVTHYEYDMGGGSDAIALSYVRKF